MEKNFKQNETLKAFSNFEKLFIQTVEAYRLYRETEKTEIEKLQQQQKQLQEDDFKLPADYVNPNQLKLVE